MVKNSHFVLFYLMLIYHFLLSLPLHDLLTDLQQSKSSQHSETSGQHNSQRRKVDYPSGVHLWRGLRDHHL